METFLLNLGFVKTEGMYIYHIHKTNNFILSSNSGHIWIGYNMRIGEDIGIGCYSEEQITKLVNIMNNSK